MSEYDLVVRGGMVVDGTGADPVLADVGIGAGTIQEVSASPLRARQIVDAAGRCVAPGFIDLHSHADFRMEGWPAASTQLPQGVTTLLGGNCGFSPFPISDVEEMKTSTAFFEPELSWHWTHHDGFAAAVDRARPAVNLATQVGHQAVRLAVMSGEERQASDDELAAMATLLTEAAESGAHGFSTGLIYAPGTYADEREVQYLVSAATQAGLLYSTHIRNESARLREAVEEAIRVAENAGARLQISHIKAAGQRFHGTVSAVLDLIDDAAERGVDVAGDVYPYAASSTTLTTRLPTWAMDGGPEALLTRLADPAQRERIVAELRRRDGEHADAAKVMLADLGPGRYENAAGSSLADIATRDGIDAAEATLRVLEEHAATVTVVIHGMSEDDVETVLRHPRVAVASDGWVLRAEGPGRPHPRSFGTFPRVLARYVRERGVLSLPEAVRKMTSLPASRLGWSDRGVIRVGAVADVVVFDPDNVADLSTYTEPWQLATGVDVVLVGGELAVNDGKPTGVHAGQVLRRSRGR
ncbi:N-acyl-D-amino-acid deacylase family protein [Phytoactinopolyspora limicola]|uniref:N-acyl-D-amino-acid deacylase family protein n=1 Tax=Phytoactinopolyspora limicola TaxID=2715536 RepID=UPI001407880B|nr:D-aminoacylase [Phytoactinopolyspora limicola]